MAMKRQKRHPGMFSFSSLSVRAVVSCNDVWRALPACYFMMPNIPCYCARKPAYLEV